MNKRSYAIIGTGALGGYYGGLLANANFDVHFLLRSDYQHVSEHGMIIDSINGDFTLPKVNAYRSFEQIPPVDVVCLTAKTTANDQLIPHLNKIIKPDGCVLVLQNGLGIEEEVANVVGVGRVVGGMCFLCSNKIGPGHICHLDYGYITLAEHDKNGAPRGITKRIEAIGEDFEAAGIAIQLKEDLLSARWHKLIWNIPYNGLSVALNTTTDHIMANPATRKLAEQLMQEVAHGAEAFGKKIADEFIESMMEHTDKMKPYKPSMYLDYLAGQPMELQAMYANPIAAAKSKGVNLPRIETLYRQLVFLDQR